MMQRQRHKNGCVLQKFPSSWGMIANSNSTPGLRLPDLLAHLIKQTFRLTSRNPSTHC